MIQCIEPGTRHQMLILQVPIFDGPMAQLGESGTYAGKEIQNSHLCHTSKNALYLPSFSQSWLRQRHIHLRSQTQTFWSSCFK